MRPLSNVRVLVGTLASVLFLACDNGHVNLGPGGPGAGDSHGGAGGGPGQGSAGHAASGLGGAPTGIGGNVPNNGGGVSSGAAGNSSSGGGGFVATGTGGGISTGTGGKVPSGVGGGISTGGAAGGAVGSGGSGAICGSLGEVTVCPSTFVCGNGTRDICALQWESNGFCNKSQVQEACDGADFGDQTCHSVGGYPTGTLHCSSKCQVDTSACNACTEDPAVLRCGVKPTTLLPLFVTMGASDSMVGLAWATDSDPTPTLRFTLLTQNLDLINDVSVKEQDLAGVPYGAPWTAVAPIPSGWVVAGGQYLGADLFIHTFDQGGAHRGRTNVPTIDGDYLPVVLIPRPNDGPLLVWAEAAEQIAYAAVVAADGRSTTTPVALPFDGEVEEIGQGTYAGGAFYVPCVVIKDGRTHLEIAKISASGTPGGVVEPLPDVQPMQDTTARLPSLRTLGDGLALSYKANLQLPTASYPDTYAVQPLDLSGDPTSPTSAAVVVGGRSIKMGTVVALGEDVVPVLLDGTVPLTDTFFGESLEVMRVSPSAELGPKHPLLSARFLNNLWFDAASVGDDVVIAWLDTASQLQLIHARP